MRALREYRSPMTNDSSSASNDTISLLRHLRCEFVKIFSVLCVKIITRFECHHRHLWTMWTKAQRRQMFTCLASVASYTSSRKLGSKHAATLHASTARRLLKLFGCCEEVVGGVRRQASGFTFSACGRDRRADPFGSRLPSSPPTSRRCRSLSKSNTFPGVDAIAGTNFSTDECAYSVVEP